MLRLLLATLIAASSAGGVCAEWVGTTEPFAKESVYFVLTDRFVNGDTGNDHREQGLPDHGTWEGRLAGAPPGREDFVGYLGGDFKGLLEHADYIRDMGFSAVWITPIVEQPDESFTGSQPAAWGGLWTDGGKSGYHGYWGTNFYEVDEHLPSPGLDFRELAAGLRSHGLKTVLDLVANHGAPAFSAPSQRDQFGKLFDAQGRLVADHQNLPPTQLQPDSNPLHAFFHREPDIAQLSNFNEGNPVLVDYLLGSYRQWLDQGADALRFDTVRHLPLAFWKTVGDALRTHRPGLFMFGEAFDYDAADIAPFTRPENGAISVLDFPLQQAMGEVFGKAGRGFERLQSALYVDDGPYHDAYALMTFYDNHDMPRLDAGDAGFIDANHFLFTARGIPVVYYGSEIGFERGTGEHAGNRNYYGVENIARARSHPIHAALSRIAAVRARTPALQRGLMLPLHFHGHTAGFYRVLDWNGQRQTALVLLNKGDASASVVVAAPDVQPGRWRSAFDSGVVVQALAGVSMAVQVPPHGAQVLLFDGEITAPGLRKKIEALVRQRAE